jgi:hypothetical protein
MARGPLSVVEISSEGMELQAMGAAWADGYAMMNDGDKRTWIEVANASGGDLTLTIQTTALMDGLPVADRTFLIPNGRRFMAGPFAPSLYNHADGTVWIDFSVVNGVSILGFKLKG